MNIIKLNDIIMEDDQPSGYHPSTADIEYFNTRLKGKYAWWVAMKYVIAFDEEYLGNDGKTYKFGFQSYIDCEQNILQLIAEGGMCYNVKRIDSSVSSFMNTYVNMDESDRINSIILYQSQNDYVTDEDITLDELKKFRTWLATELLKFDYDDDAQKQANVKYTEDQTHMLEYYAGGMYDDVVKYLMVFGKDEASITDSSSTSKCSCSGSSNISSLYGSTVTNCDALSIYRKNIYNLMVDTFSQLQFWLDRRDDALEFIKMFKKYVDNIIKVGLPLNVDTRVDQSFVDCGCSSKNDNKGLIILKSLQESLGYLIECAEEGRKNYIAESFANWAKYLYESMYWA